MLATFMFHQIYTPADPHRVERFADYLKKLSQHYPIVRPGETLVNHRLSVCLTFDDAYFDFYHDIFPVLKTLKIPATLAVPVGYILENTTQNEDTRRSIAHGREMDDPTYRDHAPFCTWPELREINHSGLITIASHGLHHVDMSNPNTDIITELQQSQAILEQQLQTNIDTFVYPYGKYRPEVNTVAHNYYRYTMRIGSALNKNWQNQHQVSYRINGDPYWLDNKNWNGWEVLCYYLKYLSNRWRGR